MRSRIQSLSAECQTTGSFLNFWQTNFPSAYLHEIKGRMFSAYSHLTEWDEQHSHRVTATGISLIYLITGTEFLWQMVFSILWGFYLSWAVTDNTVRTANAWLSVCQCCLPQWCSQNAGQILGDDNSTELTLSEEPKCLRHLLLKWGQLWRAQCRSRRWN